MSIFISKDLSSVKNVSDTIIDESNEIGNLCGFEPFEKCVVNHEVALQNMLCPMKWL